MDESRGFQQPPQLPGFQQPLGHQQHPVVIQPAVSPTISRSGMHQALGVKTTKCLSTLLVVSGVLMIVLQIICTTIVETNPLPYVAHVAGTGIWCGFFIMLSGIIGCCAASTKTNGLVITFLVFNILCTLLFSPIIIGTTGGDLGTRYQFCPYRWRHDDYGDCKYYEVLLALTVLMLLDAVLSFCLSVWAIATNSFAIQKARGCACCSSCCVESPTQTQSPIVIYLPANQVPANAGQSSQLYTFQTQTVSPAAPTIPSGPLSAQGYAGAPDALVTGTVLNPPPYKV